MIDRHPAPVAHHPTGTEPRVDLGALAPEGLPKDVTPEEIAALAAAAAQIQGKIAETKIAETKAAEAKPANIHHVQPSVAEHVPEQTASSSREAAPEPTPEPAKIEAETSTQAGPASGADAAIVAPGLAHSDQHAAEQTPGESVQEVAILAAPTPDDVMAAISSLETAATPIAPATGSGNGFSSDGSATQLEAEPVTMAVGAGAEHSAAPSRWTAVSMALAPEETAINLEEEMRNAHASLTVVEAPPVEAVAAVPEIQPTPAEPAPTAEIPSPVEPEPQVPPADAETEALQTSGAAESAATEPIRGAVKKFETVIASSVAAPDATPAEPEPAPAQAVDSANPPSLETPQPVEAKTEEIPVAPVAEAEVPAAEAVAAPPQPEEPRHEGPTPAEPGQIVAEQEQKTEDPAIPAPMATVANVEESPAIAEPPEPAEHSPTEHPAAAELALPADTTHGGIPDMAKKESDIAATTAAAWASWRRIRETGDSKDAAQSNNKAEEKAPSPRDEAAMAVAAGAEKAPEEVPIASETPEIASIVDSVLADLRPRIVEEITRKLGKKKK